MIVILGKFEHLFRHYFRFQGLLGRAATRKIAIILEWMLDGADGHVSEIGGRQATVEPAGG